MEALREELESARRAAAAETEKQSREFASEKAALIEAHSAKLSGIEEEHRVEVEVSWRALLSIYL